jgi:hypothetical protein
MKRISFSAVIAGVLVGSFAGMLHLGCSSPGKVGESTGAGGTLAGAGGVVINTSAVAQGGAAGTGGEGGSSGASGSGGSPVEGTCGDLTITPNRVPVDVLLVLDRSSSMEYSITGDCYCALTSTSQGSLCQPVPANCATRWSAVVPAVDQTIAASPNLNWGLELFSAPNAASCSVSLTPQVPLAVNGGATIQALLPTLKLALYTPTATAINNANLYLQSVKDGNDKVILLATDGEPNCKNGQVNADDDTAAAVAAATSAARNGFPVYVIGIGPSQALSNLQQIAVAGGTTDFYHADSPQALATSLSAISKIVASTCEFQTPQAPPDATLVYVYVDKQLITQDANPTDDGWMFGATSSNIVLTGSYCTNLLNGAPAPVQIIFGCAGYSPPFIIP